MKITGGEHINHPYILMTPSYGSPRTKGYTPKMVKEFLKLNHEHMVGVVGTGNTNFGEDYCKAAHNISARFQVPLLWRIDLRGNTDDIDTIDRGIAEHWETLTEGANWSLMFATGTVLTFWKPSLTVPWIA